MNTIIFYSWLADAVGSFNTAITILYICIAVAAVFFAAAYGCMRANNDDDSEEVAKAIKGNKVLWTLLVVLMLISMALPSSSTMKLVVAAKAGEVAVDTRLGKKAIEAADAVLDKLINEAKK